MKVILGKEVASFKIKGKRYKPGAVIDIPDNFPVHLYPFLKRIGVAAAKPAPVSVAAPVATKTRLDQVFKRK